MFRLCLHILLKMDVLYGLHRKKSFLLYEIYKHIGILQIVVAFTLTFWISKTSYMGGENRSECSVWLRKPVPRRAKRNSSTSHNILLASWTLTMTQHLVIPLPGRGVCNSSVVKLRKRNQSVWRLFGIIWITQTNQRETRKSYSRCWFKTFLFQPVLCLQMVRN
jgi:hypothetical protein